MLVVKFSDLFRITKKYMGDGDDVPYFFRELMAMLTSVTEDKWGTKKDPNTRLTKDETIKTYVKRKIPRKFAQNVVHNLTPEILEKRINELNDVQKKAFAEQMQVYDSKIDEFNLGRVVSEFYVQIFKEAAGLLEIDDLNDIKNEEMSNDIKAKFGMFLLNEVNNCCPFPGCGKSLFLGESGKLQYFYSGILIDKAKKVSVENCLAVCPECANKFWLNPTSSTRKELREVKKILVSKFESEQLLNEASLEKGIVKVVESISKLKQKDLESASLFPKKISEKINPDENVALYSLVSNYVSLYFIRIREILQKLDKSNKINYGVLQDQIHAFYKSLERSGKSQNEIFESITNKIHSVSLKENFYCQIVVSYFIQSCEVFDAIAK